VTKKRRPHPSHDAPTHEADGPETTLDEGPVAEDLVAPDEPAMTQEAEAPPPSEPGDAPDGVPFEMPFAAVKRLQESLDELQDRHARLAAEFDNYRKRVNRERLELGDRAQGAFAVRLLEVLDDLDRLLTESETAKPTHTLHEALVLVDRKLRKELEGAGLERIQSDGAPFDPSEHEAVAALPPPEPELDHHVAATFQAGYRFKGNLIRPARVQVYTDQG
jgi:molecular chaperone GrpE